MILEWVGFNDTGRTSTLHDLIFARSLCMFDSKYLLFFQGAFPRRKFRPCYSDVQKTKNSEFFL